MTAARMKNRVSLDCQVQARFYQPPPELRRFFTTFYLVEFAVESGDRVTDYLHPEWGNLRFLSGDCPDAEAMDGTSISGTNFCVTGPSSKTVRFTIGPTARMWGIGFLPLGWAKFVRDDARELANALLDGNVHPAFASFASLGEALYGPIPDVEAELGRIGRYFLDRVDKPVSEEERIRKVHAALVDPRIKSVAELVERVSIGQRTIERTCDRAFGFRPKLLLRRQRFLRSLSHYMLDPSLKWIGALDGHYHDQAQFVRDFKEFMGMSPRQYAALDKPILSAVMLERARFAGKAVQGLDTPEGGGPEVMA